MRALASNSWDDGLMRVGAPCETLKCQEANTSSKTLASIILSCKCNHSGQFWRDKNTCCFPNGSCFLSMTNQSLPVTFMGCSDASLARQHRHVMQFEGRAIEIILHQDQHSRWCQMMSLHPFSHPFIFAAGLMTPIKLALAAVCHGYF